jgi:CRISPR/Cas system CSM-associated protein Csm2 small subunit
MFSVEQVKAQIRKETGRRYEDHDALEGLLDELVAAVKEETRASEFRSFPIAADRAFA